jgi:CrcB protein
MPLAFQIALVAFGSACGGLARWGVGYLSGRWFAGPFPIGTLAINLVGSFLLGWLLTWIAHRTSSAESTWVVHEAWRLAVGVGFCGAFTTFSTFEFETHQLLRDQLTWLAIIYIAASVTLGLVALRAGVWLGENA